MKIVHISDVHIRNLKYHQEYRKVFDDFYKQLEIIKPDIIINTGDLAHTKTQISPEFVEMTSEHLRKTSDFAPYHLILGNHDMNLMNLDRQDAITPIVDSINKKNIFLHKKSGPVNLLGDKSFMLWVFSMADEENYPKLADYETYSNSVNIGLFHGAVSKCITDSDWKMTHVETDLSLFNGLDYVLLGDIHRQQFFNQRKIAYAGSMVQQNFGEDIDKGFLLWNIDSKESHDVKSVILKGGRPFVSLKLNEDLSLPKINLEPGVRLRIIPPRSITLAEQKTAENEAKSLFKPHDIITLSVSNIGSQNATVGKNKIGLENLRQLPVQEKLIREFLEKRNVNIETIDRVLALNKKYQVHVEQNEDTTRNVSWKIKTLAWSNMFNFGENNIIDFSKIMGLTGIFAPNASGKSNIIDVVTETCFDNTTKGVNKNVFLINDNKLMATSIAEISANDQDFIIERTIERIKYGKKSIEEKEWGKTSVNFSAIDDTGESQPLVGTLRPETERNIRQQLGNFDDFMLTTLSAQWNPHDLIACKESKRKEIFYRFLDLDIFATKGLLAKEEAKPFYEKLDDLSENDIESTISDLETSINELNGKLEVETRETVRIKKIREKNHEKILELTKNRPTIVVSTDDIKDIDEKINLNDIMRNEFSVKLDATNFEIVGLEIKLGRILSLEGQFDLKLYNEKVQEYDDTESDISRLEILIGENKNSLKTHLSNTKLLNEVPCGDKFPSCKFLTTAVESKNKIVEINTRIAEHEKLISKLRDQLKELEIFKVRLDKFRKLMVEKKETQRNVDNLILQRENINLKQAGLVGDNVKLQKEKEAFYKHQDDIAKLAEITNAIAVLKTNNAELEKLLNSKQKDLSDLNRKIGSDQGILEKLRSQLSQLAEIKNTCHAFELYSEAMGKDGIAYEILTQKIPLLNEEINKILSMTADFGVNIEHDIEEQSIRIYLQYGQYKGRLIELASGAEKMLASIAIRTALLSVSNLPKMNMFIIDEGFGKLDPKNMENIQTMFDYLKTMYDHVLIISHIEAMKDIVDNIIEISSDDEGYAHVEVV